MMKNKLKQALKLMQKIYLDFNKKENEIKKESTEILRNALKENEIKKIKSLKEKINNL